MSPEYFEQIMNIIYNFAKTSPAKVAELAYEDDDHFLPIDGDDELSPPLDDQKNGVLDNTMSLNTESKKMINETLAEM